MVLSMNEIQSKWKQNGKQNMQIHMEKINNLNKDKDNDITDEEAYLKHK